KRRIPSVPAENPESNTHPKVAEVASPLLSSISDAKSKSAPKSKIARKCTAFLRLQTPNSPTRFREDPQYLRSTRSAVDWKPKGWLFFYSLSGNRLVAGSCFSRLNITIEAIDEQRERNGRP